MRSGEILTFFNKITVLTFLVKKKKKWYNKAYRGVFFFQNKKIKLDLVLIAVLRSIKCPYLGSLPWSGRFFLKFVFAKKRASREAASREREKRFAAR